MSSFGANNRKPLPGRGKTPPRARNQNVSGVSAPKTGNSFANQQQQ